MVINVEEYMEHLQKELPHLNFSGIEKIEDYKNDSEIYEVSFSKEVDGKHKDFSFRMIAGYLGFTDEQFKENFVKVANLTYKAKLKEDAEEEESEESND